MEMSIKAIRRIQTFPKMVLYVLSCETQARRVSLVNTLFVE